MSPKIKIELTLKAAILIKEASGLIGCDDVFLANLILKSIQEKLSACADTVDCAEEEASNAKL